MTRRHHPVLVICLGAALAALAPASCGGGGTADGGAAGGGTSGGGSGSGDALLVYEGGATDEALAELRALTPRDDAAQRASFTAPADGQAFPAGAPPTFQWSLPDEGSWRGAPLGPGAPASAPAAAPRLGERALARMLELAVSGAQTAHAHGDPVNGRAYLLSFRDRDGALVVEVFTLLATHTPSTEAWAAVAAAPQPVRVDLVSAVFESNRVAQDGGPFQGASLEVTIESS